MSIQTCPCETLSLSCTCYNQSRVTVKFFHEILFVCQTGGGVGGGNENDEGHHSQGEAHTRKLFHGHMMHVDVFKNSFCDICSECDVVQCPFDGYLIVM